MKTITRGISCKFRAISISTTIIISLASFHIGTCRAQTVVYDDTTTATGYVVTNGGASGTTGTALSTKLVADDLTYNTAFAGQTVTQFTFSVGNLNTSSKSATENITFYDSNGTSGAPGTVLAAFTFNPIAISASSYTTLTYTIPAGQGFVLPTSGTIWAGEYFTSSSDSSTVLNKFGQATFSPPGTGSSLDEDFTSTSAGSSFTTSSPAGTVNSSPYAGTPVADFGWQIVVPEPATWLAGALLVGVAGTSILRRRRWTQAGDNRSA